MIKPGCDDTVCTIINRIPEQQDVLAWEGVRSWANKFHYTPAREKPSIVNQVWFSDHKKLDLMVRTKRLPDGTWEHRRPLQNVTVTGQQGHNSRPAKDTIPGQMLL